METHLTEKQSCILEFISSWSRAKGFPPSLSELSTHFNFASSNSIRCHLSALEKKGYIRINSGKARSIQVINLQTIPKHSPAEKTIPILGKIAAGLPIWAEQNMDGTIPVPPAFFGGGDLFALVVCGNSMINAGILDKDIVVIRKQSKVENGEIAAVCIENEVTLKRFHKTSDKIILKAENSNFQDIVFNTNAIVSVIGKLQGVLRKGQAVCR